MLETHVLINFFIWLLVPQLTYNGGKLAFVPVCPDIKCTNVRRKNKNKKKHGMTPHLRLAVGGRTQFFVGVRFYCFIMSRPEFS